MNCFSEQLTRRSLFLAGTMRSLKSLQPLFTSCVPIPPSPLPASPCPNLKVQSHYKATLKRQFTFNLQFLVICGTHFIDLERMKGKPTMGLLFSIEHKTQCLLIQHLNLNSIGGIWHIVSRIWNSTEPKYGPCWMRFCSC